MKTKGALIISLGDLCRWLGERAEALGVDSFPGTAAADLLPGENGERLGLGTGGLGEGRDGTPTATVPRGRELGRKQRDDDEGARGWLAKRLIGKFGLDQGKAPQKYGLGIKEIWEIDPARHSAGKVEHFMGYPLGSAASGGGFCYHAGDNRIYLGLVAHLDY